MRAADELCVLHDAEMLSDGLACQPGAGGELSDGTGIAGGELCDECEAGGIAEGSEDGRLSAAVCGAVGCGVTGS